VHSYFAGEPIKGKSTRDGKIGVEIKEGRMGVAVRSWDVRTDSLGQRITVIKPSLSRGKLSNLKREIKKVQL